MALEMKYDVRFSKLWNKLHSFGEYAFLEIYVF